MSTVNEALKSLILALGGDPESMYDNTTVSDYIKDLETAMQASGSGVKIDDTTASDSTVYSSAKTEALVEAIPSLPSVAVGDIGEALIVESDGEGGAQWGKGVIAQNIAVFSGSISGNTPNRKLNFANGVKLSDITAAIQAKKFVVIVTPSGTFELDEYDATGSGYAVLNCVKEDNNIISFMFFTDVFNISQDSTFVSITDRSTPYLPSVTTDDNDKILKVVNGKWTAVTP